MHHAFDAAAPTYDTEFTHTPLALWLRDMVWSCLPFQPGDHVLEIGCGTGEDALWMAQRGIFVTATDASPAMLAETERKIAAAGVGDRVKFAPLDMNQIGLTTPPQPLSPVDRREGLTHIPRAMMLPSPTSGDGDGVFDGIFSNFGVLNCAANRPALAAWLAQHIHRGGKAVLVIMNPLCPWEIVWHLAHGQVKTAFRRLKSGGMAHAGGGQMVQVWYPSPGRLRREFAPFFRPVQTIGIGALLPPSYLGYLVARYPKTFERAAVLDGRIGRIFPFTVLNDHYLIVMERR